MINIITFDKRVKYIFEIVFSIYEIEYSFNNLKGTSLSITYGENIPKLNEKHLHISQSNFFKNYKKQKSLPKLPLKRFNYRNFKDLIGLYSQKDQEVIIKKGKDLIILNLDIIAGIFFMITRYEEYIQPQLRDRYNRFSAENSIAFKEKFLNRPIVDEYIELLFFLLKKLDPTLKRTKNKFKNFISHDIDQLLLYDKFPIRSLIGDLIKRQNLNYFFRRIREFWLAKKDYKNDPYWIFDYFISNEKHLKSTFYFMANRQNYNLQDPKTLELIELFKKNGLEIGLHGSFNSFNDKNKLKEEKEVLDRILKYKKYGIRQHYLRFDVRNTWQIQDELGFKYDTTCGYHDYEGFRCGTSHPFRTYDLEKDRMLNLIEIPLILMDTTLSDYRKIQPEEAIIIVKYLKNVCKKYGGFFTSLWHNSFFYEKEKWKEVYGKVIS